MSSSKQWARNISFVASRIYFFLILFQVPLFRCPCRIGACTTPMEVACPQFVANEMVPESIVKALLYPGATARALISGSSIPSYNKLLKVYKIPRRQEDASSFSDYRYLEIIVGCYLAVAGALLSLIRSSRLSLIGVLLILWGIYVEILFPKHKNYSKSFPPFRIYLPMWIALFCAFLLIRSDVRKIIRSFKPQNVHRPFKKAKIF